MWMNYGYYDVLIYLLRPTVIIVDTINGSPKRLWLVHITIYKYVTKLFSMDLLKNDFRFLYNKTYFCIFIFG